MEKLAHVSVRTTMRPPRAAILFRGDENWRRWARLALLAASNTWAGGGHLLVPYGPDGAVSERMLRAVEHFDPDHVLLLHLTPLEVEWAVPGLFQFTMDGQTPDPEERLRVLAQIGSSPIPGGDPPGIKAREKVAAWCTPFINPRLGEDDRTRRPRQHWIRTDGSGLVTAAAIGADDSSAHLDVPISWDSDASLVAGSYLGVRKGDVSDPPEESPRRYLPDLRSKERSHPLPLGFSSGTESGAGKSRFDVLDAGVVRLMARTGQTWHAKGAVVIGDTAEDFALARAYDLLCDFGLWLSPEMLNDEDTLKGGVAPMVLDKHHSFGDPEQSPAYVSTSLGDDDLDDYLARLDAFVPRIVTDPPMAEQPIARTEFPSLTTWHTFRAVDEDMDAPMAVPVERDDDGTLRMVTRHALPAPKETGFFGGRPSWIVDFVFDEGVMPNGRALGPESLVIDDKGRLLDTIVRSSRYGLSVEAKSFGFVAAGSVRSGTLAHPRLVNLGLFSWAHAMASEHGYTVRYSTPGTNAQISARRLGSRADLVELVTGPMNPALRLYAIVDDSNSARKRRYESMLPDVRTFQPRWVGDLPYATFDDLRAASAASQDWALERVDRLVRADLVTRGVILKCADCGRDSFVPVGRLGSVYDCPRCGAENRLTSIRWGRGPEPKWYYDLHTSLRQLLTENGDVPLLAAAHFQREARRYADIGEIELWKDGQQVAEVDLLARVGSEVVVCEAKRPGKLPGSAAEKQRTATKLAIAAKVLRADRVSLATVQSDWPENDLELVRKALGRQFGDYPSPAVEAVAGLSPRA